MNTLLFTPQILPYLQKILITTSLQQQTLLITITNMLKESLQSGRRHMIPFLYPGRSCRSHSRMRDSNKSFRLFRQNTSCTSSEKRRKRREKRVGKSYQYVRSVWSSAQRVNMLSVHRDMKCVFIV